MEEKKPVKFYNTRWFSVTVVVFILLVAGALISNASGKLQGQLQRTQNAANESMKVANSQAFQNLIAKSGEATTTAYKVGDHARLGSSVITVNKVSYSQGGQFGAPSSGNEWLDLNVTIENTSSSQQYVSTLGQMFVRDAQGNSYQVTSTDKTISDPSSSLDGTIIAHSKRTGWVGFEIPKGATGLQFQYEGDLASSGTVLVDLGR